MAINKTFVAHTELKAQDLNDLVTQANGYVSETKTELNGNIATAKTEVMTEVNKKPNILDLKTFDRTQPLPLDATYYYGGLPTHSVTGSAYDAENEINTDYIGICINHEDESGFEPQHHDVMVFVKSSSNYIYSETFNTSEASGYLEVHIARALGSVNATPNSSGLMSAQDKGLFNDVVTEVFPVKAVIASSNAGTFEVGTSVTPTIELNITRKGVDVASSAAVAVSPSGTVAANNKTITDSAISSGSKTYHIEVTQGGQTVVHDGSDSNDEFKDQLNFTFMNYRYRGAVSANNIPSDATAKTNYVKQLCQNNTISKELSTSTQLTGKNALAADKCYVFVITTQSPNLIVKDANSGGVVDNAGSGTFELARVNGTGTVNCKYVIVPASSNAWNFEITN